MKTDEQLVSDFIAGDPNAFQELYDRYYPKLTSLLSPKIQQTHVEDIIQDTFLILLNKDKAGMFDPYRSFQPWIFTIAMNKFRDLKRNAKKEVVFSFENEENDINIINIIPKDEETAIDILMEKEYFRDIRDIVNELPTKLHDVIILFYYNNYTYKEIGEILDCPVGTIKTRLNAARENMKRIQRKKEKDFEYHKKAFVSINV